MTDADDVAAAAAAAARDRELERVESAGGASWLDGGATGAVAVAHAVASVASVSDVSMMCSSTSSIDGCGMPRIGVSFGSRVPSAPLLAENCALAESNERLAGNDCVTVADAGCCALAGDSVACCNV